MSDLSVPTLLYVTDPMCSWCWGFSPVMEQIYKRFEERLEIELCVGGLRPGNTERFDNQRRNYILRHWRAVHDRTSQPFNFTFNMGQDFRYDTEPAARAVVVVRQMAHDQVFPYLQRVQKAFYVHNDDITKEAVLADLAQEQDLNRSQFLETFQRDDLKRKVWDEFGQVRELGVSGFPTLLAQQRSKTTTLTHGYQSLEILVPVIETWLNSTASV